MKQTIPFLFLALCAAAQTRLQLFTADPAGNIQPAGVAVETAVLEAANARADAARGAAGEAAGAAGAALRTLENVAALTNEVGYVRGFVTSYGAFDGLVNTNAGGVILKFEVDHSNPGHTLSSHWVFFNTAVETPKIVSSETLGGTNAWADAVLVDYEVLHDFEAGGVAYDPVFRLDVRTPKTSARFFRSVAEAMQSEVGTLLGVRNGLSIDGVPGIHMDVVFGGQRIVFKGGARVQPQGGTE